jgi:hypothetical protein
MGSTGFIPQNSHSKLSSFRGLDQVTVTKRILFDRPYGPDAVSMSVTSASNYRKPWFCINGRAFARVLRCCLLALYACGQLQALEAATEITEQSAAIVYEAKADIPTPIERIAEVISEDYRALRDEFSKHEFLQTLKPSIERRIKQASEEEAFFVQVGVNLPEYDFNRSGFPTGSDAKSFIPYNGRYAVRFSNPDQAGLVAVPLEDAKRAANALKSSRRAVITYTGSLDKTAEETLNYQTFKVIYLKIDRITVALENGTKFVHEVPK